MLDAAKETEVTLNHHLQSFGQGDIDAIMSDYTEDSVLFTPEATLRGIKQVREFFEWLAANLPAGFMESFEMVRQDIDGEVAYILWKSGSKVPVGTDTFVVRDGKIATQTFAAYMEH